ncbi:hypothetical protein D3C74_194100 [compost metagenome]
MKCRYYKHDTLYSQFPIERSLLSLGVICLGQVADDVDNNTEISKLIMILDSAGIYTLGALIAMTFENLWEVSRIGTKRRDLLFKLLQRLSSNPELLMTENEIKRLKKLEGIKNRLREMGMIR